MTKEKSIGNIYIQAAGLVQQLEGAIFSSSRVRFNKKFENALDDRITGLIKAHSDFVGIVNPVSVDLHGAQSFEGLTLDEDDLDDLPEE